MSSSFSNKGSSRTNIVSLRKMLPEAVFVGGEDIEVRRCVNRAKACRPGDVFVPLHNAAGDEHDRVDEAIKRGAVAVVAERLLPVSIPQCLVESNQPVYARLCQALAGDPCSRMLTIGIVGTHGKTTASLFVASMLKRQAGAVAYYTSLGKSNSVACDRTATTVPGAKKLADWLMDSDKAGAPAAVIEVPNSMMLNHTLAGVQFDLIIVTGLRPTQRRGSLSARSYQRQIDELSMSLKPHGVVLYNADDAGATAWAEQTDTPKVSYGLDAAREIRAKRLSRNPGEQQLLVMVGNMLMPLTLKTIGDHAARGALAAVGASWLFDLPVPEAIAGIEALQMIPGRMQRMVQSVDLPLIIDAADTPDRVAVALHAMQQHQLGPATVVLEMSTTLDPKWRQRMGEVLDRNSTNVVLTTTQLSPQSAQSVAMDYLAGFRSPGRVQVIPDRAKAIEWAVQNTDSGSMLLAGCGASMWLDRDGYETCDEWVAKYELSQRERPVSFPSLSVFPPTEPGSAVQS